MPIQVLKTMI